MQSSNRQKTLMKVCRGLMERMKHKGKQCRSRLIITHSTHTHTHTRTCTPPRAHTLLHTYTHMHTHTPINRLTPINSYTRAHTHLYTRIHTHTPMNDVSCEKKTNNLFNPDFPRFVKTPFEPELIETFRKNV